MKRLIFTLAIFFVFFNLSYASSGFGSIQTQNRVNANSGDETELKILFYNMGSESVELAFETELPDGWDVAFSHSRLELMNTTPQRSPAGNKSYFWAESINAYIETVPLNVMVNIPWYEQSGEYGLKITARSSSLDGETLSLSQERKFIFTINVSSPFPKGDKDKITEDKTTIEDDISLKKSEIAERKDAYDNEERNLFWKIILAATIIIAIPLWLMGKD